MGRFRLHGILLTLALGGAVADASELQADEAYLALAREIPSQPVVLVDSSGQPHLLSLGTDGLVRFSGRVVASSTGATVALPNDVVFQAFPDRSDTFLIEHMDGRSPVYRLGKLVNGELVVSDHNVSKGPPGTLVAMPGGQVARYARLSGNRSVATFNVATMIDDELHPGPEDEVVQLPGELIRLGIVRHPVTREPGLALLEIGRVNVVHLVFAGSGEVKIDVVDGLHVFAAGQDSLIAGFFQNNCKSPAGLPEGMCTPYLIKLPIPERSGALSKQDVVTAPRLAGPKTGWTFGANDRGSEPEDMLVVGDRVYVISYQGMTQALGYFLLSQPGTGKTILAPEEAVNIGFNQIVGSADHPGLIVSKRKITQPTEYVLITDDDAVKPVARGTISQRFAQQGLATKTFGAKPDMLISPMVMVGNEAILNSSPCKNGRAVVEVYGGYKTPMRPTNLLGLFPSLFEKGGVFVQVSIPGSGGYGLPWAELGAFSNAPNQIEALARTVQVLRKSGCNNVTVTGFSHGGIVALNTLLKYPDVVDSVIIGGVPLDLEAEYRARNPRVSVLLPRDATADQASDAEEWPTFANVSPKALANTAGDLSRTSITLLVGKNDTLATTYLDQSVLDLLAAKGTRLKLIARDGVGHTRYASIAEWAEYFAILESALDK